MECNEIGALSETNIQWDWIKFSEDMFSSLVGFLLAIVAALIVNKVIKSFEKKECIKGIINELKEILLRLTEITNNIDNQLISPIESNYWNSIIGSSKISLINNKRWFIEVSKIYSKAEEINEWLKLKTQCSLFVGLNSDSDSLVLSQLAFAQVLQNKIILENSENGNTLRNRIYSIIKIIKK